MNDFCTRPMSNRFKLDVRTLPTHAVDRYSRLKALVFFVFAVLLAAFGIYEFINGLRPSETELEKFIQVASDTAGAVKSINLEALNEQMLNLQSLSSKVKSGE